MNALNSIPYGDILTSLHAIGDSLSLNQLKLLDNSVRAGGNDGMTALIQMGEGAGAISFTDAAITAAGVPEVLPGFVRPIIWLFPAVIGIIKGTDIAPECMRPVLVFMQDHYGTLCHTASIVSALS